MLQCHAVAGICWHASVRRLTFVVRRRTLRVQEMGPKMCCPVCKSSKVKLHTMGFYKCKWEWWGKIITQDATQDGRVSGQGRADDEQYHVFEGTQVEAPTPAAAHVVGDTKQYTVLVFKASKLK